MSLEPDPRPQVLVLMAARNGSLWIAEQIDSILAQAGVSIDLVISDDYSTDATRSTLNGFSRDTRVQTLSPPAPTGSAAQNFFWLMRHAPLTGHEYVALADQDDIWDSAKIYRGTQMLRESGSAGYSCSVIAVWPNGTKSTLQQVGKTTAADFLLEGAGQGCTFVLTAQFFREVRAFLEAEPMCISPLHYHDWTIYALARSWGKAWYFDPHPFMHYRQHLANDTGARRSLAGVYKRLKLIKEGWYRRQLIAIGNVCAVAAPGSALITTWNQLLRSPPGLLRRAQIAFFCVRGGRRRTSDNLMVLASALCGLI